MNITKITPQLKNKSRYNLYSQETYIGSLDVEFIVKYHIKENCEMSDEAFSQILQEDQVRFAYEKGLNWIAYARRTEKQVRDYFKRLQIEEEAAQAAVDKLKEYRYVDDQEYAADMAQVLKEKGLGKRAVAYKLMSKGIDRQIAFQAAEDSEEQEEARAKRLYEKLAAKYAQEEPLKRRRKINANMAAKGFSYDLIAKLFSEEEW